MITRDSFHVTELHIMEDALRSSVRTMLDFASESEAPPELRSLYKSLMAPSRPQLTTRRLAIVPYGCCMTCVCGADVHEILGLDLHKTDLIVLSGCKSQKGKQTRGDDATALSRAFLYAGAPSVVASLWNVDDEATKLLMVGFIRLRDGMSKAEALQAAQKEVRGRFPHPYYCVV